MSNLGNVKIEMKMFIYWVNHPKKSSTRYSRVKLYKIALIFLLELLLHSSIFSDPQSKRK